VVALGNSDWRFRRNTPGSRPARHGLTARAERPKPDDAQPAEDDGVGGRRQAPDNDAPAPGYQPHPEQVITHVYPADKAAEAFAIAENSDASGKVLVSRW
jgi:hypothetical protein